jgi:hypothetical protein
MVGPMTLYTAPIEMREHEGLRLPVLDDARPARARFHRTSHTSVLPYRKVGLPSTPHNHRAISPC